MALPPIKYCPVTGNLPMTCTEKGFLEACESFRRMPTISGSGVLKYKYCGICQGKEIPGKVIIINLEQAKISREKQEDNMKNKSKPGKCYQCGKVKSLRSHHGQSCCATCGIVRSKAKNDPGVMIAALREFNNMPDWMADAAPDGSLLDLQKENAVNIESLEKAEGLIKLHDDTIGSMEKEIEKLRTALRITAKENNVSALDRLALGIMDGSIIGVSHDLYQEMREVGHG